MMKNNVGLYIHIPFCAKRCDYCDFLSCTETSIKENYVERLMEDIATQPDLKQVTVDTIFFGGGTPSLLTVGEIDLLAQSLNDYCEISKDVEFSVEMNPESVTEEKVRAWQRAGMNRVSLGIQSFHDELLEKIGRIHSGSEGIAAFQLLRQLDVANINLDLMFGLPGQKLRDVDLDLKKTIELQPEHISYYSLILEEGTTMYEKYSGMDEVTDRKIYHHIIETLELQGYRHYEISNFAKEGKRCRHNLKYWKLKDYVGVGAGAHSSVADYRYSNEQSIQDYVDSGAKRTYELISRKERIAEYLIMGIRLIDGIDLQDLKNRFQYDLVKDQKEVLERLQRDGLINIKTDRVFLTKLGLDLANVVENQLYFNVGEL